MLNLPFFLLSGIQNIKTQKWFASFGWSEMESLSMKPPYAPASKGQLKAKDREHHFSPGADREEQKGHEELQRKQGGHAAADSVQGSQDWMGQRFRHQRVSLSLAPSGYCFDVANVANTQDDKQRLENKHAPAPASPSKSWSPHLCTD